ncbi:MAG: penicillin-binding protein 2 [Elusimicrobiota bacterium]|nr:penicillin-binding protein 2 [Elusimicrobiota bacterium]
MPWEGESDLIQEKFLERLKKVFGVIFCCFAIILLRFFYYQTIKGDYYYKLSEENRTKIFVEHAPRGTVYDCHGRIFCSSKSRTNVYFYPFLSKRERISDDELEFIDKLLPGVKPKLIEGYKSKKVIHLTSNLPRNRLFKLLEQKVNLKDISVVEEMVRDYPYKDVGSHIIGYVGEISPDELKELVLSGYKQGDIVGKAGIEKQYDSFLRGIDGGWLVESDAFGRQLNITDRVQPIKGSDYYLTIDLELQQIAEDALKQTHFAGAIVGLDPSNGAVRILVSQPGFDPNLFVELSNGRLKYFTDKSLPLYNRATAGEYAPGSVFKIITAVAALQEKKVSTETEFFCPGYFKVGTRTFKCWEEKGHKRVNFIEGVRKSCDVYFYNLGLKVGIEKLAEYAQKFNLGKLLNIDLPTEKTGFVPTAKWRKTRFPYGFVAGDTANIAIGQGYLTTTPLQLAALICAVATKGEIYQPYLTDKIVAQDKVIYKHKVKKITTVELDETVWQNLRSALTEVVNSGTGHACFIPGVKIAGKTGTAQNPHGPDHAWFVAYAPVENPKLALSVFVEHGGKGGAVAAPIAKKIFQKFFSRLKTIKNGTDKTESSKLATN